jgi:hypothetical protein
MPTHPIDVLLGEIASSLRDGEAAANLAEAVDLAGGQDVINVTAAFVNVLRDEGTVLGPAPPERLEEVWTLQVCHRMVLSLKIAFTSRDPSEATWRRFVTAWERAHLDAGYFAGHPRAFEAG